MPINFRKARSTRNRYTIRKFAPQDQLSYYPNPVKEELNIRWGKENEGYVQSITVYSIDGRQMSSISRIKTSDTQTVPFLDFPAGMYIVMIRFDNEKEESIKIVKK